MERAVMSQGYTAYDFVREVYYLQEKTLLDWWVRDDKFQEVLHEANMVIRELEAQQDWTWLRQTVTLGPLSGSVGDIAEFIIPETFTDDNGEEMHFYKLSTLNHDAIRMHFVLPDGTLDPRHFIPVPIASAGDQRWNREWQVQGLGVNHVHDYKLRAVVHGNRIKFNRPLLPFEARCVAVADVQIHIKPFHMCDLNCKYRAYDAFYKWDATAYDVEHQVYGMWIPNPAPHNYCRNDTTFTKETHNEVEHYTSATENVYLTEVPDPNYLVVATAARHAEGSPPALARVAGLQDNAQKLLSQMRQNDTDSTDSDYVEWDVPGYLEVI